MKHPTTRLPELTGRSLFAAFVWVAMLISTAMPAPPGTMRAQRRRKNRIMVAVASCGLFPSFRLRVPKIGKEITVIA
jgi:hypothetical protein